MSTNLFPAFSDRGVLARARLRAERERYPPIPAPKPTPNPRKVAPVRTPKVAVKTEQQMDELAEIMAEGCGTIRDAAQMMGVGKSRVDRLWQRIRAGLGEQAQ